MKPLLVSACSCVVGGVAFAQAVVIEPPDYPQVQPGPQITYTGTQCFLAAEGQIFPGDVDWIQVRVPRASSRTVIDVDFPTGSSGSALLAIVQNGTTGFNIGDNNNTRDALCGMNAASSPVGSLRDSVVDVRTTPLNAVINIAVTGAADTSFVGLHNDSFWYELWVYALPVPCTNDLNCDDGIACTLDQCNVDTGDCANTPQDSACDDGVFCDGAEWCDASLGCRLSPSPSCDDNVPCTDDYCDVADDQCANDPWDELCNNDVFCDGEEYCDPASGCQAGDPVDCNDGVACTVDSCNDDLWQCTHTADDSACDDGLYCNGVESCDAQSGCVAGAPPCGDGLCRESDDRCVECLSAEHCDDGVYCNGAEQCNSLGECVAGSYPCSGSLCRETDDQCVECLADTDCADGEFCNGAESCNPDGFCADGGYPCDSLFCREVDDRCVECLSDADCADGDFCNGDEQCNSSGICMAGSYPCGDAMCRESDDQCVECLADEDCADEFFCNGNEGCAADGLCVAGTLPCSPAQSCNEDTDQCASSSFSVDIKPGVCPMMVVTSARGYLPVAIVGLDVASVDVRTVRLGRADGVGTDVQPVSSPSGQAPRLSDVSGPSEACTCPDNGSDGFDDLVVSFRLEEVVHSLQLDKLGRRATVELTVSGTLLDGTPFSANDCVKIQTTGNPNAAN